MSLTTGQNVDFSLSSKMNVSEQSFSLPSFKKEEFTLPSDSKSFGKMVEEARSAARETSDVKKSAEERPSENLSQTEKSPSGKAESENEGKKSSVSAKDEAQKEEKTELHEKLNSDSGKAEKKLASANKSSEMKGKNAVTDAKSKENVKNALTDKNALKNQKENPELSENLKFQNEKNGVNRKASEESALSSWENLVSRLKNQEKNGETEENSDFVAELGQAASLLSMTGEVLNAEKTESDGDFELSEIQKTKGKKTFLDKDEKISVTDLRSKEEKPAENTKNLKFSEAKIEGNNAEIRVNIAENTANANVLSSNMQTASSDGSNFQAMLSNQLQSNAHEIVKAGNIVLKDNNVGEIKLILNPEELGNVKISLHIDDKAISGKIIVESEAAFNAMKESVQSLKEAFASSGFDTGAFDLSFAGQQNDGRDGSFNDGANENTRNQYQRAVAYEGLYSEVDEEYGYFQEISANSLRNSVNIVA